MRGFIELIRTEICMKYIRDYHVCTLYTDSPFPACVDTSIAESRMRAMGRGKIFENNLVKSIILPLLYYGGEQGIVL